MMSAMSIFPVLTMSLGVVNAGTIGWFGGSPVGSFASASKGTEHNVTLSRAMAEVQQTIDNIQKLPDCKRIAAKDLVHSCMIYDGTDPLASRSTEAELDLYQKLFAIRTSYCELKDAAQSIPSPCNAAMALAPSQRSNENQIQICLDALYQETNPWTTYTSMKTNGLIMCHAMRAEKDKDEQLHLFRVLVGTTSDINKVLQTNREELQSLVGVFSNLSGGMRNFYNELHKDNEKIKISIKRSWEAMRNDMSGVSGDIKALLESMHAANSNLHTYTSQVDEAFAQAKDLSTQMGVQLGTGLTKIQESYEETKANYQYQLELYLADFDQRVFAITNSMETANSLSSELLGKLTVLNDELDIPKEKIGELVVQVDYAKDVQFAILTDMQGLSNATFENLQAVNDHAASLNIWLGGIAGFAQGFLVTTWPAIMAFFAWFFLFVVLVLRICWKAFGPVTGSIFAPIATSILAAMSASLVHPFQLCQDLVSTHPAFFHEVPPYLSVSIVFSTGLCSTLLVQSCARKAVEPIEPAGPTYDPAKLRTYPPFQDDLEVDEQKRYLASY